MNKLSIVIVSYNVRSFIDHTLSSVFASKTTFDYSIYVVDNNSIDDSVEFVKEKYPKVNLISLDYNPGFSIANNIAIKKAKSEYILLLNPDTIIQENTLDLVINYLDENRNVGGLGVKMIDGSGNFLPESKRGFPSPWVAMCKMTGLSRLFPKSKLFNSYHLGYLSENENHSIDVLSGACMFLRKNVLDEIGLLDEDFFMYGEDIDISYRIKKAGFDNIYFADTEIIHFKGESTKKASFNYIKTFYNAMIIFGRKHFAPNKAGLYMFFLNTAIYLRAIVSFFQRQWRRFRPFIIDNIIIIISGFFIKEAWESIYYNTDSYYNFNFVWINLIIYSFVYTLILYYNGGYDKNTKLSSFLRSLMYSSIVLIAFYGLLDEGLRFSRAIVFFLSISNFITLPFWRIIHSKINKQSYWIQNKITRYILLGNERSENQVNHILAAASKSSNATKKVVELKWENDEISFLLDDQNLNSRYLNVILFHFPYISYEKAFNIIRNYKDKFQFAFLNGEENFIVESASKQDKGQIIKPSDFYNLNHNNYRRQKRLTDIVISLLSLLISPFLLFRIESVKQYFANTFNILFGFKTWVGYKDIVTDSNMPSLKPSVISTEYIFSDEEKDITDSDNTYARKYSPWLDLSSFIKYPTMMGKNSKTSS